MCVCIVIKVRNKVLRRFHIVWYLWKPGWCQMQLRSWWYFVYQHGRKVLRCEGLILIGVSFTRTWLGTKHWRITKHAWLYSLWLLSLCSMLGLRLLGLEGNIWRCFPGLPCQLTSPSNHHWSQWNGIWRWKKGKVIPFIPSPSSYQHLVLGNHQFLFPTKKPLFCNSNSGGMVPSTSTIPSSCSLGTMGGNEFPLLQFSGYPASLCFLPLSCGHTVRILVNKNKFIL